MYFYPWWSRIIGENFLLLSISASFSVWAVDGGADPSENSAGNPLPGTGVSKVLICIFDTDGDTSWGWDASLLSNNGDLISNVSGGDINGGWYRFIKWIVNDRRKPAQDVIGGPFLLFFI